MPCALDGVRVIDFGQYVAGPLVAELLAQNGADVVHIDPPAGPRLSGLPDAFLNRGKRRIVLDLTREEDRQTARGLCLRADVVVENFRPGVMDKFGLGAGEFTDTNPGLVYCSLPGFAGTDPRSTLLAWEGVVMSATAGYRRLGEHWDWKARANAPVDDPSRPLMTALPLASNTAAFLGAGLTRHLRGVDTAVIEVPRPNRRLRRDHGKSDPIDAEAAARAVLAGHQLSEPKYGTGVIESIRALRIARNSAVKAATAAINALRSMLVTEPEQLRAQLRGHSQGKLLAACAALTPNLADLADPAEAAMVALRSLALSQYRADGMGEVTDASSWAGGCNTGVGSGRLEADEGRRGGSGTGRRRRMRRRSDEQQRYCRDGVRVGGGE